MSQRSVVLMRCLRNFAPAYGCVRLMDVQRRHQNRPAQVLPARGEGHEVLEAGVKVPKQNDATIGAGIGRGSRKRRRRMRTEVSLADLGCVVLIYVYGTAYKSLVVCITGMSTATACSQRSPLVRASRGRTRSHHTDWPTDDGLNCFLHVYGVLACRSNMTCLRMRCYSMSRNCSSRMAV